MYPFNFPNNWLPQYLINIMSLKATLTWHIVISYNEHGGHINAQGETDSSTTSYTILNWPMATHFQNIWKLFFIVERRKQQDHK